MQTTMFKRLHPGLPQSATKDYRKNPSQLSRNPILFLKEFAFNRRLIRRYLTDTRGFFLRRSMRMSKKNNWTNVVDCGREWHEGEGMSP